MKSGNVFADLGLAQPEGLKTTLVLAVRLNERFKALGLKQADIAKRLGIAQPNVSALQNYRLDNFSSEKLLEFFNAMGYDVDLLIRPAPIKQHLFCKFRFWFLVCGAKASDQGFMFR